jgi:hypothetical protein
VGSFASVVPLGVKCTFLSMSDSNSTQHGSQFSPERYQDSQESDVFVGGILKSVFDAHNVVDVEPDETYDNYAENKPVHQLIDYAGIDYIVDTFEGEIFGVNHRTHFSSKSTTRRFDFRKENGVAATSELDKLLKATQTNNIVPKYASRMKRSKDGIEWFRVVELRPLIGAIDTYLEPVDTWHDDNSGVVAWFFDFDTLREMNVMVADLNP